MKIYCSSCSKYLGEIRDATLRKNTHHLCDQCEIKRKAADMHMQATVRDSKSPVDEILRKVLGVENSSNYE